MNWEYSKYYVSHSFVESHVTMDKLYSTVPPTNVMLVLSVLSVLLYSSIMTLTMVWHNPESLHPTELHGIYMMT